MLSWKKAIVLGGIGTVLLVGTSTNALTAEEIQSRLQLLYERVASLQAQIEQRSSNTGASAPGQSGTAGTSSSCVRLSNNLRFGMRDTSSLGSVATLQRFLKASGDYTYPEITGYFGAATRAALQRYQTRARIVSSGSAETTGYGAAGPRTRQFIETTSCASARVVPPTSVPVNTGLCKIQDLEIANGASIQLYSTTTAPIGQACSVLVATRTCVNGSLSGSDSFKYPSCVSAIPKSCKVGSISMADGESRTFYDKSSATSGDTCAKHSQERKCGDGTLSGSSAFTLTTCEGPRACMQAGATVSDGQSRNFFFVEHVPSNELCSAYALSRSCANGALGGDSSYKFASCAPISANSCTVDNLVLETASSSTFYSASVAPAGKTCASISQVRTCTSGSLSGGATYNRASCSDTLPCKLDGQTLAHASSSAFYSAKIAPYGTTCSSVSEVRTCTNASLSGSESNKYASCAVAPPSSCTLDTTTLTTGSSDIFYKTRTVAYGSSCEWKTRVCSEGVLGGDAAYQYSSCKMDAAPGSQTSSAGCTNSGPAIASITNAAGCQ